VIRLTFTGEENPLVNIVTSYSVNKVQKNDTAVRQRGASRVTVYVYHRVGEYNCKQKGEIGGGRGMTETIYRAM